MALATLRNPATGEQQAIDAGSYVAPVAEGDAYYGWEKIGDGLPLADLKIEKARAIDAALAAAFLSGFTPATGPLAGHTLQVRDDTDRTNWLTAKDSWRDQRDAGNGATMGAVIRTETNEMVSCSYDDGFATLQAMADWGFALMGNSWTLKGQVAGAVDEAALDAVDITVGWA